MTQLRISWIDDAKFIAILCVIIGHAFSLISGFRGYDEINLFIVAFNMPLFALLSGITSYKSLTKIMTFSDLISYLNKILWRVGVPTVIWTLLAMTVGYGLQGRFERCLISGVLFLIVCVFAYLIMFLLSGYWKEKAKQLFPLLILPICLWNQSVWYFVYVIMAMFLASVSSYIANQFVRSCLVFCFIFSLLSYLIAPLSPFFSTLELCLPFIVGYIYAYKNGMVSPLATPPYKKIISSLFLLLIGVVCFIKYYSIPHQFYLLNMNQAFHAGEMQIFVLRQISAVTLSVAIISFCQILPKSYNYISSVGAMTFGIYPIHSQLLGILKTLGVYIDTNILWYKLLVFFFFVILLLSISMILVLAFRKSTLLKALLLGETNSFNEAINVCIRVNK